MTKKTDIILIAPPLDEVPFDGRVSMISLRPPLGLSCLAEYLKRKILSLKAEILDGDIFSLEEVKTKLTISKPLYVGISPTLFSYKSALEIARFSKNSGAKVIFGGLYATGACREILLNRGPGSSDYCVDAVCQLDGEECLAGFVSGRPFNKIPNLIYRNGAKIEFNKVKLLDLDQLPRQDFSFADIIKYFSLQDSSRKSAKDALSVYSRKGCGKRSKSGACYFCSLIYQKMRYKSPLKFFRELDFLIRKYAPKVIFDVSDDFLDNENWLSEFYRLYKNYLPKPEFQIYTRVSALTPAIIKKLAELNAKWVFLGVESGDNRMLSKINKGHDVNDVKIAVRRLTQCGIRAVILLILGGMGETPKSLKNTVKFSQYLKEHYPDLYFSSRVLKPVQNSLAYRLFIQKTGVKYKNLDFFDQHEAFADWLFYFTKVSYSDVIAAWKKINALNQFQ